MAQTFLNRIVAATKARVAVLEKQAGMLEALARSAPPTRDFAAALRPASTAGRPRLGLIAEIKRASPSKGPLNPGLDVAALARAYQEGGAAALSVLTEPQFFQGSFDDLKTARNGVALPVLRKDFILDAAQVYEARANGADAILLIVAILPSDILRTLRELAASLGMATLVEVHNKAELRQALDSGASIIGINNRDLVDFTVDLDTTFRLRPLIPPNVTVVSESGIHTAADVARLRGIGVHAVLIGEALVTSPRPEGKIRELLST